MKRIIAIYGLVSGATVAGVSFGAMAVWGGDGKAAGSEWLGYSVMVIALSLIFVAVKSYRDEELGGVIRFSTALKLGLGISLVAGVIYVIGWEIYYQTLGAGFMDDYIASSIEQMLADGASAARVAEARREMEEFKDLYSLLPARMGITLLEILPVGLVISLICAGLLRTSAVPPASGS